MYDEQATGGVARLAAWLGALSLLALVATGPVHRFGLLRLAGAFAVLKYAVFGAAATLVLAIIGMILSARRRGRIGTAVTALVMALLSLGSIGVLGWKASRVPAIHDVTTDTIQPPLFVAILPLRAGALNPSDYGGAALAAKQQQAYPEIAPLLLTLAPDRAFDRALATARTMGWELAASDPAAGRIEATDTTFWFGFKDDIVIRVTPQPAGSRVDIRSLSRVGVGDLGANAARIRAYLAVLKAS